MTLELEEGRVYGARYYTVHPVLPEMYHQPQETWVAMMAWMVETYGPTSKDGVFTPGQRWYVNNAKFWFRTEADRDWFLLKWA